jgi:hypothetical protein
MPLRSSVLTSAAYVGRLPQQRETLTLNYDDEMDIIGTLSSGVKFRVNGFDKTSDIEALAASGKTHTVIDFELNGVRHIDSAEQHGILTFTA